jgi:hypothetical protein
MLIPKILGRAFQMLTLAKNVDPLSPRPTGFKFAREPGFALAPGKSNQ